MFLQMIKSIKQFLPAIQCHGLELKIFQEEAEALKKYGNNKAAQYAAKISGCGDLFQCLCYDLENQLPKSYTKSLILNSKYFPTFVTIKFYNKIFYFIIYFLCYFLSKSLSNIKKKTFRRFWMKPCNNACDAMIYFK